MTGAADERGAIGFAEKVLELLDLVIEQTERSGRPPDVVTTRQLAEKIVEIYWPQTRPFARGSEASVLVQNVRGQAEILGHIARFRTRRALDSVAPMWEAAHADPAGFERLVREVEWKLIEMPLPRLQVIGTTAAEFIYTIGWDATVRREMVRRYQTGAGGSFDNRILLKPGVGGASGAPYGISSEGSASIAGLRRAWRATPA
ncbi:MAG: hypothetical protein HYR51_11280 [Candidatus Rokubacteria bacterium]|nr:hypothetical protein [Candidatus Rokubacteria bacterium]